jgi:hypothetical protein
MKRLELDWSVLRGASILLVLTVLFSGSLVWASYYYRDQMRVDFLKDNSRFQRESRRYLAVDEEDQLIRQYLPLYRDLEEQGVIGPEHRLNWTETLRKVGVGLKLPSLRYSIEPQETYTPPYTLSSGAYQTYASAMQLHMGLLHEMDLFRFLDHLERNALGRFTVDECSFRRQRGEIDLNAATANISAECRLSWITLRKPGDTL